MKKIIALLLVGMMLFSLVACGGGSKDDPNLGLYTCTAVEAMGMSISPADFSDGEITIDLKSGGKAVFDFEGESANVKWKLDGEAFELSDSEVTMTGTLKDGVLILDDFMGMTMVFEK